MGYTRSPSEGPAKRRHLADNLLQDIADERWRPNDKISTEEQLRDEYGYSRTTVRDAVTHLCYLGMLERKPPHGTFVLPGACAQARLILQLDRDLPPFGNFELGQPRATYYRLDSPDGSGSEVILYPDDGSVGRLPTLAETRDHGLRPTELLEVVWRANGEREIYRALGTRLVCRESPPSDQ